VAGGNAKGENPLLGGKGKKSPRQGKKGQESKARPKVARNDPVLDLSKKPNGGRRYTPLTVYHRARGSIKSIKTRKPSRVSHTWGGKERGRVGKRGT